MSDPLANIPLSALRLFEAAARLKSFTRAAEELGVTQAAVSWQVKALERRLGQALFHRLPREVALTAPGERLARATNQAMGLLRAALSDLSDTGEGVLAISTFESLATKWLAPRLGAFHLAHPNIAVRLQTEARVVDLTRENIDVALRSGGGDWPGLESVYLFSSATTPLCSPDFITRHGGFAKPEDLLTVPRIGPQEEWTAWFAEIGVAVVETPKGPRWSADLQTIEVVAALDGHGIALGSPILFAPEIAQGRLIQPFAAGAAADGGYWLVYPSDRQRSAKTRAFREWILSTLPADPSTANKSGRACL